jgi:hypothetical protein
MSASPLDRHLKSILEKRLEQLAGALQGSRRAPGVESVHDLRVASHFAMCSVTSRAAVSKRS